MKHIEEKFDQLFEYEQGGITFLKIVLDEMFTMSNMVITLLPKFLKQFAQEGVARVPNEGSLMRMFDCVPNRLLPGVRIWPKLMHYLRRYLAIFWRDLPDVWLWNSKRSTNSLTLPIKSARCGQSVGSGTVTLLLRQFRNFAVRLMTCSTP